ncbi:MAG: glycosyltransferase [Vicinamibacterales bacterium]|jgi:rhamnosyltransferase subunit B|nr:glycosyltransferase [Vicinamibacterales bacterium]
MRALLVPVGSAGDVHPHVGLALALRDRGHDVTIATNAYFRPLIDRLGLRLITLGTAADYERITANPDLWHHRKGLSVIAGAVRAAAAELYGVVREHGTRSDTVVVAHGLAFAARTAQDALGIRLVTAHLQPSCFHSVYRSPVLHPALRHINVLPRIVKRLLFRLIDLAADRALDGAVNHHRRELGLEPARHLTSRWWHSPTRVIGMFPEWFAPAQPDWPPVTRLTGFPLYDERGAAPVPADVGDFLDAGDAPVVFVAGSGNRQATWFFQAAADACRHLGHRGLLLTRYRDQLPSAMPEGVRHFDYVPLTEVLPRSAALVHHGGIGSAAQALAAGVPHLVAPMTFDQPDNADRLRELGVARVLRPSRVDGRSMARELEHLLGSTDTATRCRALAARLDGFDGLRAACEVVEAAE